MINPDNTQFYSGHDTFKNFDSNTGTISVPSQSYAIGQVRQFSTTIALAKTLASTQLLHNISLASTRHYFGGYIQENFPLGAPTYSVQIRCDFNSTNLVVECYVINQGGVQTLGGFTVDTTARRFVNPFS